LFFAIYDESGTIGLSGLFRMTALIAQAGFFLDFENQLAILSGYTLIRSF